MLDRSNVLGFATEPLVHLDSLAPGLISRVLTASPKRRQAIFMVLARRATPSRAAGMQQESPECEAATARVLRDERASEVLMHQFGAVPDGVLGALERIGGDLLSSPAAYLRLWSIFAEPEATKAEALRYVGRIDERILSVIDVLDPLLVHGEVLQRVNSMAEAHDLNRSVAFLKSVCSRATDEAMAEAIGRMRSPNSLSLMLNRFFRRADRFPLQPFAGDAELRPLTSARDFFETGVAFRNCLRSYLGDALLGGVAFAAYRSANMAALCEFRPLSNGGWMLADIHVERNGHVPSQLREQVQQKCAAVGIPHVAVPASREWRCLKRLLGQPDRFDDWMLA